MSLSAVQQYLKGLLQGLQWPAAIQALPSPPAPLVAMVTPINPWVESVTVPTAQIWMEKGSFSRNPAKYGAGTVPRAAYKGGPSGTKAGEHAIPIYVVWENDLTDPNADTLFTGMLDAIREALEYSPARELVTDPWDGTQSYAIDVGETIQYETGLFTPSQQRLARYDALLTVPVVEVYAA